MIVGTTPTHTFNIPFDISIVAKFRVIYAQNDVVLFVKTENDEGCGLEDNRIVVTLTEEDTFKVDHKKPLEYQIRILTTDRSKLATVPKRIGVTKCLEDVMFE